MVNQAKFCKQLSVKIEGVLRKYKGEWKYDDVMMTDSLFVGISRSCYLYEDENGKEFTLYKGNSKNGTYSDIDDDYNSCTLISNPVVCWILRNTLGK